VLDLDQTPHQNLAASLLNMLSKKSAPIVPPEPLVNVIDVPGEFLSSPHFL
jgi:hypothetical protein